MNISINVRCTYEVECDFENVPEEVAKKLLDIEEVEKGSDVYNWLSDHIKEADANDWNYDIWSADKL